MKELTKKELKDISVMSAKYTKLHESISKIESKLLPLIEEHKKQVEVMNSLRKEEGEFFTKLNEKYSPSYVAFDKNSEKFLIISEADVPV